LLSSASGIRIPASTASNAEPPFDKMAQDAEFAAFPKSQVDITIGLGLNDSVLTCKAGIVKEDSLIKFLLFMKLNIKNF
jgi:hypothetical protein